MQNTSQQLPGFLKLAQQAVRSLLYMISSLKGLLPFAGTTYATQVGQGPLLEDQSNPPDPKIKHPPTHTFGSSHPLVLVCTEKAGVVPFLDNYVGDARLIILFQFDAGIPDCQKLVVKNLETTVD